MRVSGRDVRRFGGKPRMKGPLSGLEEAPKPAPTSSSSPSGILFSFSSRIEFSYLN